MTKKFFTADLHFGHRNIIQYCGRKFSSVEEMDGVLLENINSKVSKVDYLYIIGDFTFGTRESVEKYRKQIRCSNVYLINGNHDREYDESGIFRWRKDIAEIKENGQLITLCHYAMRTWNKSHYGSWMLYGHSHGMLPDDPTLLSFDVGVDCHNYKPLSFAEVKEIMSHKQVKSIP